MARATLPPFFVPAYYEGIYAEWIISKWIISIAPKMMHLSVFIEHQLF